MIGDSLMIKSILHMSYSWLIDKLQIFEKLLLTNHQLMIQNVIKALAKSVLIPLGLTDAASAADAGIHEKILGSGHHTSNNHPSSSALHNTILTIWNDKMKDIIKIIKSLEDSGLLMERVNEKKWKWS